MTARPLQGLTIGVTADRRAEEQAQMLEQRGARVVRGAVIRTAPVEDHETTRQATESLIASPPDVVVANTALGVRTWLSLADGWGVTDHLVAILAKSYVVARGPKAEGALLAVGVGLDWRAPSGVLDEVIDHVIERGVAGRRVALQVDGGDDRSAVVRLRDAGADVEEVATYRWSLPRDRGPALRLVDAACEGRVDAVTFTAAPAVHNFFDLAEEAGAGTRLRAALDGPVLAMCVGPVCRKAALSRGVATAREPVLPRLGGMVKALGDELGRHRRTFEVDGTTVVVQGSSVLVGVAGVSLAIRERAVFEVLTRRPGAVAPRRTLMTEVWGTPATDPHALEVAIGRLRRRLLPTGLRVESVLRRGYRLTWSAA